MTSFSRTKMHQLANDKCEDQEEPNLSNGVSHGNIDKGRGRPYKVWNRSRSLRKSFTACHRHDLINKGCRELGIEKEKFSKLVEEEDGTEVKYQDYFSFLPDNSTFIILEKGEEWEEPRKEVQQQSTSRALDSGHKHQNKDVATLAGILREDPLSIRHFSYQELEDIVAYSPKYLACLLKESEQHALSVQDNCQELLGKMDEEEMRKEWTELLEYSSEPDRNTSKMQKRKKAGVEEIALHKKQQKHFQRETSGHPQVAQIPFSCPRGSTHDYDESRLPDSELTFKRYDVLIKRHMQVPVS